jgi:hypothetical protein
VAIPARSSYLLAAGLLLFAPATSHAQSARSLSGIVRDSAGHAVPSAEVRARGNVLVARSDDSGRFHVPQMPVGARGVFVRRLGFVPQRVLIPANPAGTTDSIAVTLIAVATALPSVTALAQHDSISRHVLAEFWTRKARGFGKFITRDDIDRRGGMHFTDLVRTVPSVIIQNHRGRPEIRFSRSMIRDCPPQYWVDGVPLERGSADEFTPDNVEAIELYSSPATTPPQYATRSMTCGTILIWSRLPG